jgi:nitroreductase
MKAQLLEMFSRRHACHLFKTDLDITADDLNFILEAGRLSPSSFGLEQWKFIVLSSQEQKLAMQAACFQQPQVGSASVVIVVLAKLAELHPDADYLQRLMAREYPDDALEAALKNYRSFYAATDIKAWSENQCHIAAANMMTAAAGINIDSCAIGGFDADAVRNLLAIDATRHHPSLILAFGHCAQTPGKKQRLSLQELVEYR